MTIDLLPEQLKKVLMKSNGIKLYDCVDPGNLCALFEYKKAFNDPNRKSFDSNGSFSAKKRDITMFRNGLEQNDLKHLIRTLAHETGHFLDVYVGSILSGSTKYFTDIFKAWENAKQSDGKNV